MKSIFLSASIPSDREMNYFKSADPFLIQAAVREFAIAVLGRRKIVWGGHPTITPMIWEVCKDLGVSYVNAVKVYQSEFFKDSFPRENEHFKYVTVTPAVPNNREGSLRVMREQMLGENDFEAAVFIGGMHGIEDEFKMFRKRWPKARIIALKAPGGAARNLSKREGAISGFENELDFVQIFHKALGVDISARRSSEGG